MAIHVWATTRLPSNWMTFLQVDSSKTGPFKFLVKTVIELYTPQRKFCPVTCLEYVLSDPDRDGHSWSHVLWLMQMGG